MKILILGGTRFIGKEVVNGLKLLKSNVTIFSKNLSYKNRKNHIIGDRNNNKDLTKLNRKYDVIVDFISYNAMHTKKILSMFPSSRYILISTSWKDVKNTSNTKDKLKYIKNKRLAELETKKNKNVYNKIIRLPIVLGSGDHTGRTDFFKQLENNMQNIVYVTNPEIEICFCWKTEVSDFIINQIFDSFHNKSYILYPKTYYKIKLSEFIKIYQQFEKKKYIFRTIEISKMDKDRDFVKYLKNVGDDFYYPTEILGKDEMKIEKNEKLYLHIEKLYKH